MKDLESIHLQNPDEPAVDNAYRSLPRIGEITLSTSFSGLESQLPRLEQAGFAGMEIKAFNSIDEKMTIRALKGKQGTCYDTGRFASYKGAALAAMDDDHHLLLAREGLPVCEKTATLYSMPPYRDLVHCSEPSKEKLEKLQTDPELFDCDNFETLQEKLYNMVRDDTSPEDFSDLFYPGPFKLLVLADGTIVHRGRANKVPAQEAKNLVKRDGLFKFKGQTEGRYESFTELFKVEGPRCLLNVTRYDTVSEKDIPSDASDGASDVSDNVPDGSYPATDLSDRVPDLSSLSDLSRDLKNRLLRIIENQKDYFILTGSNREDEFGCCPSDEVTMADKLVRGGILSASREQAPADACPVTIYAFRNEIKSVAGNLQFIRDEDFRKEVYDKLKRIRRGKPGKSRPGSLIKNNQELPKTLARWILLIFVMITILLAVIRITGPSQPILNRGLHTRLDVTGSNSTVLVLFHYHKRCEQCLAMESYAREVLEDDFPGMTQNNQIQFRQVIMDQEENRSLTERLGLFTATLVIIRFEDRQEDSIRVLDRSWALYDNEAEFKKMLSQELNQMIGLENE